VAGPARVDVWCDSCGYAFRIRGDVVPDTVQCPRCGEAVAVAAG
jgi:hypothetical protein